MTRHFFTYFSLALVGLLTAPVVSRANVTILAGILESNVVHLRVSDVDAGISGEINGLYRELAATNKIAGIILDLRFADGDDATGAAATTNLFAGKKLPLAILVNGQTHGAALALATALREARAGLIFSTAKAAIKPDISVEESPVDEKKFYDNPYALPATNGFAALTGTNDYLPWVDHTSEADLVRAKIKDGDEFENPPPVRVTGPPRPVIRDPVLARAVDLIKGLAIVREFRS